MSSFLATIFGVIAHQPETICAVLATSSPIMNCSAVPVTLSSDETWNLLCSEAKPENERKLLQLFSTFSDTMQFTEQLRIQNRRLDKDFVTSILENLMNKRYFTRTIRLLQLPSADALIEPCSSPLPTATTTPVVFSNLRSLTIEGSVTVRMMQNDEQLKTICSRCPFLESMSIPGQLKLTDGGVEFLLTLKHLKTLDLQYYSKLTDSGLQHLATLSSLQSLKLTGCNRITDSGLARLGNLASLQTLHLTFCKQITDSGLVHLGNLPSLQLLNLSHCNELTDSGFQHLATLSSLKSLNLDSCDKITDGGLLHLATLSSLESLNLERCSLITDDGLQHLATLSTLRSLNLKSCKITDTGLQHLSNVSSLQSLNLGCCWEITIDGLQHLSQLLSLQTLNLLGRDKSKITNEGCRVLFPLTKLIG